MEKGEHQSKMTDIENIQSKSQFTDEMKTTIIKVVDKTLEKEMIPPKNVSVLITDDTYIKTLNLQYRNIDRPTDVLSFPLYDENGELDDEELGDIVISLERAYAQADEYGHSIIREVAFLTAHSMLHLLGYDHETDEEREEMFAIQEEILNELKITRE